MFAVFNLNIYETLYVLAQNLRNVDDKKTLLPLPVTAHVNVYDGTVSLDMKMNDLAENSTFDMNAETKNVNLVKLNNFLKAYGNFDVTKAHWAYIQSLQQKRVSMMAMKTSN